MNKNYKVILFDIGNVLFHISMQNALHYWSVQTSLSFETIKERFRFDDAHKEFERGNISAEDYRNHISKMIGVEISPTIFFNGWNMIYLETFPQIETVLSSLKKNYTVAALSNTNITHEDVWKWKYKNLLDHLEFIFASHKIRHIKPDKSCYQYIINELNVDANEILFFDDKLENIEGAQAIGIAAIQVKSPLQMYQSMQKEGVKFELDWSKL